MLWIAIRSYRARRRGVWMTGAWELILQLQGIRGTRWRGERHMADEPVTDTPSYWATSPGKQPYQALPVWTSDPESENEYR